MIDPGELAVPELARFWRLVAARLERNGLRARGTLAVDDLTRDERHALAGLLGRPVTTTGIRIDLAAVDVRLRDVTGRGLVATVEQVSGALVDRPAERRSTQAARDTITEQLRGGLRRAGLEGTAWAEEWLEELRRTGLVARIAGNRQRQVVDEACAVLVDMPGLRDATASGTVGRGELASRTTGSAHGLDDGTLTSTVVLRAVALAFGEPTAVSSADRRRLWRLAGVSPDEVSTTVLTAGLLPADPAAAWLRHRTERGWESHLTRRDLARIDWLTLDRTGSAYVCENPRVLEAALDAGSPAVIVCTQGNPSLAVHELLDGIGRRGVTLRYHGDFDWPGITIANGVFRRHGCTPWRYDARDFEEALALVGPAVATLPRLKGRPVEAEWDPGLATAMARADRVVHEELLLDLLLADIVTTPG